MKSTSTLSLMNPHYHTHKRTSLILCDKHGNTKTNISCHKQLGISASVSIPYTINTTVAEPVRMSAQCQHPSAMPGFNRDNSVSQRLAMMALAWAYHRMSYGTDNTTGSTERLSKEAATARRLTPFNGGGYKVDLPRVNAISQTELSNGLYL